MEVAISFRNVSKRFGRVQALENVSFAVPSGAVFALLGENGAGKTTLIRGLLGNFRLHTGQIEVLGMHPRRAYTRVRRHLGYVAETPVLYDWMTVKQIGWFASGFYSRGYLERYANLARQFGLPPRTRIRHLSKGMRAKTALALAMASQPKLLVLDEPTSGLDPLVRRSFLETMIEQTAQGQTVFLSSHQIHEVERVADHIAILHRGKLVLSGSLEEWKSRLTMVNLSVRDVLLPLPPELSGDACVRSTREGRTWTLLVRDMPADYLQQLTQDPNAISVQVRRPALEDLYLAFTQESPWSNGQPSTWQPEASARQSQGVLHIDEGEAMG